MRKVVSHLRNPSSDCFFGIRVCLINVFPIFAFANGQYLEQYMVGTPSVAWPGINTAISISAEDGLANGVEVEGGLEGLLPQESGEYEIVSSTNNG